MWSVITAAALLCLATGSHHSPWPAVMAVGDTSPAVPPVWPIPTQYELGTDTVWLSDAFTLDCGGPEHQQAQRILLEACQRTQRHLSRADGLLPPTEQPSTEEGAEPLTGLRVQVTDDATDQLDEDTDESYQLTVNSKQGALLKANSVFGALRGLETFLQLVQRPAMDHGDNDADYDAEADYDAAVGKGKGDQLVGHRYLTGVPLTITDQPIFKHRGVLLDVARSYFPVRDILRQLDAMAMVKMNVLHLHLVDSQSFPVASEVLPELAEKGAYSPRKVYTRRSLERIIRYAYDRGIRIIPEYDTPGHTFIWGKSHPEVMVCQNKQPDWPTFSAEPPSGQLDPTNPESIKLVGTLLREQASWFPDRYMHVGGDEVNANCYTREPHIASYLQEHNMNASQLIAGFAQQLHSIVRESNKRPITWEEAALEYNVPMDNDTLVQVWTSAQHVEQLVRRGLSVLTSPADAWYLDCGQGGWITSANGGNSWCDPFKTWQHVYRYDPLTNLTDIGYTQAHHPLVAGGEVTLWTEKTDRHNLDSKLWPRAAAAAETLWSGRRDAQGQERTTFAAFLRLHQLRRRLVRAGLRPDLLNMLWCEQNPDDCNIPPE